MTPTIGRTVRFRMQVQFNGPTIDLAAVISRVNPDGSVNLAVLEDYGVTSGPHWEGYVHIFQGDGPGCWHWPERV